MTSERSKRRDLLALSFITNLMKWIGKSIKGPIIIYKGGFKVGGSDVNYQTTRVSQE